jgi:hypothetical protein
VAFFERRQQGAQPLGGQNPVVHTFTSTIVIVSVPKMSTTLTASLRRPGRHS